MADGKDIVPRQRHERVPPPREKKSVPEPANSDTIGAAERAFAQRLWRTRVRELRDLAERYGFSLEDLEMR